MASRFVSNHEESENLEVMSGSSNVILQSCNCNRSRLLEKTTHFCTDCGDFCYIISDDSGQIYLDAKDVQKLLIGISSPTFILSNTSQNNYEIITSTQLDLSNNLYARQLLSLCKFYVSTRNFYQELKSTIPSDGILHGLASGVEMCLMAYEGAVNTADLDGNIPISLITQYYSGLGLHTSKLTNLCITFEETKKNHGHKFYLRHYGIHIIKKLYEDLRSDTFTLCSNMFNVLILKHCLDHYFIFLQKWLFEGLFLNNHEEWGFRSDFSNPDIVDELVWSQDFYDDININDHSLPSILKACRSSILTAGKSVSILKRFSENHPLFSTAVDIPILKVHFSNEADEIRIQNFLLMLARLRFLFCNSKKLSKAPVKNMEIWQDIVDCIGINENNMKVLEHFKLDPSSTKVDKIAKDSPEASSSKVLTLSLNSENKEHTSLSKISDLSWINNFPTCDKLLNILAAHIVMLLNENKGDIKNLIKVIKFFSVSSMTEALKKSVFPLLNTQIELIHRCILHSLFVDQELYLYFEEVRDVFFKNDIHFFSSFQQKIFESVRSPFKTHILFSPSYMHCIMSDILEKHQFQCELVLQARNVPNEVPEHAVFVGHKFASYLFLAYKVKFPLNIILTEEIMSMCSQVFMFLVQVQFFGTYFNEIFIYFKHFRTNMSGVSTSEQYGTLYNSSHQMFLFITALIEFFNVAIHEFEWPKFLSSLKNVRNIDDLKSTFLCFVQSIMEICHLQESECHVHNAIISMLDEAFFFNLNLLKGNWKLNKDSDAWIHTHFDELMERYEKFKIDQNVVLTAVFKHSKDDIQAGIHYTPFQFMA